jgi:hypothetical protein
LDNDFLDTTSEAQVTELLKINKLNYIKNKNYCISMDTIQNWGKKTQQTGKKHLQAVLPGKGLCLYPEYTKNSYISVINNPT